MARLVDDRNEVDGVTRPICIFSSSCVKKKKNLHLVVLSPLFITPYNALMALGPHVSTPGSRILLARAAHSLAGTRKDGHQRQNFFFCGGVVVIEKEKKKKKDLCEQNKKNEYEQLWSTYCYLGLCAL